MAEIRLIGGKYKRRKLTVIDSPGLRPTGSRSRETLFNWLAQYTPSSRCLDLFAGSGALGLEALSRDAQHITFIESNVKTYNQLKQNIEILSPNPSTTLID